MEGWMDGRTDRQTDRHTTVPAQRETGAFNATASADMTTFQNKRGGGI